MEKLSSLTFGKAIVIGLALMGIYYFAAYDDGSSQTTQIESTRQKITQNQAELNKIQRAVQDAREFQELQQTLGSEMDRIASAIPKDLTDRDMMRTLSEEAKNVGLNIANLAPIQNQYSPRDEKPDFIEPVPANLELAGTYSQVMIFLSNLTRLNRIITIKTLNLATATTQNTSTPQITLKGEFVGYKFVTKEADKAAAGGTK